MTSTKLTFPCGDIRLEGSLHMPEGKPPIGAVVVCHPHPLYGGDMQNNVVEPVCDTLARVGIAALRFNFRGVGNSEGSHDQGAGEQDDAAAAFSVLSGMEQLAGKPLGICGYSFGAAVAYKEAYRNAKVRALAAISIQASAVDAQHCFSGPKLLVTGSRDLLTPAQEMQALASRLCEPKEVVLVPDVDHFWLHHEQKVAELVTDFFVKAFGEKA